MAKKKNYQNEIRLRGVSEKLIEDLSNISKNLGITISQMLKPKIREIVESYPEKMKQKPLDY